MTSRDIRAKLDQEHAKREQAKEDQKAKKDQALFQTLGVKPPREMSHDSSNEHEKIVERLNKFRMGNIVPRKVDMRSACRGRKGRLTFCRTKA